MPLRELGNLARFQQQFARPFRLVVETVGLQIFGNIRIDEKHLASAIDARIAFRDGGLAGAQGFHLGAGEHQARFKGLADFIIVARPPVVRGDLVWSLWLGGHLGHSAR